MSLCLLQAVQLPSQQSRSLHQFLVLVLLHLQLALPLDANQQHATSPPPDVVPECCRSLYPLGRKRDLRYALIEYKWIKRYWRGWRMEVGNLRCVEVDALFCWWPIEVVGCLLYEESLLLHVLVRVNTGVQALYEVAERLIGSLYRTDIGRFSSVK